MTDQSDSEIKRHAGHRLFGDEFRYILSLYEQLKDRPEIQPIITKLASVESWEKHGSNQPIGSPERESAWEAVSSNDARAAMFELRIAAELIDRNVSFIHERVTVDESSVDFFVNGDRPWLIELAASFDTKDLDGAIKVETLPIKKTFAKKGEKRTVSIMTELWGEGIEGAPSVAQEMVRLQGKIKDKVWNRHTKKPRKFPSTGSSHHAIIFDTRGHAGGQPPDRYARVQLMFGPKDLAARGCGHFVIGRPPVLGLFDKDMPQDDGIRLLHERIHIIRLTFTQRFDKETFLDSTVFYLNPFLPDAEEAWNDFPFNDGRVMRMGTNQG